MFYSIVFRHHLSKTCQSDLLELFHLALPEDTEGIPKSRYLLQKALNVDFEKADKYFYCDTCDGPLVGEEDREVCPDCKKVTSKKQLNQRDKYFYMLDMRQVLTYTLEIPANGDEVVRRCMRRNEAKGPPDVLRDVTDGECYHRLGKTRSRLRKECNINSFETLCYRIKSHGFDLPNQY